jgi:hypothetical protein
MKPEKKKPDAADEIEAVEIELERIPVHNVAEVVDTLDRVRVSAQKLISKISEETHMYERGEISLNQLAGRTEQIGKALATLNQGLKIVLATATAKQKLNSGK